MVLRVEAIRTARMERHLVDALPELRKALILGKKGRLNATVRRGPALAAVASSVDARRRHHHQHVVGIGRMRENGVQACTTTAGHPLGPVRVPPEPFDKREALAAVL